MSQPSLFEEPTTSETKTEAIDARDQEDFYKKYIVSPQWKKKRKQALERANHKCEKCNGTKELEVHHLTYDRLGREELSDLLVVCKHCHPAEDKLRAQRTESDRYRKAINSFGGKKYGEEWDSWKDPELVREEFHDWLERRG